MSRPKAHVPSNSVAYHMAASGRMDEFLSWVNKTNPSRTRVVDMIRAIIKVQIHDTAIYRWAKKTIGGAKLGRRSISSHLNDSDGGKSLAKRLAKKQLSFTEIQKELLDVTGITFNRETVREWAVKNGFAEGIRHRGIANVIQSMPIESRRIVFLGSLKDAVNEIKRVAGVSYSEASVTTWRVGRRKLIESCEN